MKKYTVELSFMVPRQTVKIIEAVDENFARESADVIISPLKQKHSASNIYQLGKMTLKRIR